MQIIRTIKNTLHYLSRFVIREKDYWLVKPKVLMLFLTYRCTSKCQTCNMWTRHSSAKELTLAEWQTMIDHLSNHEKLKAEIFGGDVLLRPELLVPLIKYMKKSGISYIDMPTNCNLLDQKMAQELAESNLDLLYISLDSVEEEQNQIRGIPDSYTKIKNAIAYIREARGEKKKPQLCVNTTISNLNYLSVGRVAEASKALGADEVSLGYVGEFNPETIEASSIDGIKPNPFFVPQENSHRLNREQAGALKTKLKELKQKSEGGQFYLSIKNIDVLGIDNLVTGKFPFKKCYVSHTQVSVDPYGNVYPCPFYPDYVLGNLKEHPLSAIWNNEKHRRFMKAVSNHQLSLCFECILSMERNPTFWQAIRQMYFVYTQKGLDEPGDN